MKELLAAVTMLLTVLVFVGSGQQAADLRNKYGAPDAKGRYIVRPGIGMTVEFAENGLASKMVIKRLDYEDGTNAGRSPVMSSLEADNILEEVAPVDRRGKLEKKAGFASGCFHISSTEYEHVTISTGLRCEAQGGGTYSLTVRWK